MHLDTLECLYLVVGEHYLIKQLISQIVKWINESTILLITKPMMHR